MQATILVELDDSLPSALAAWEDLFLYANKLAVRRGKEAVFEVQRWKPSQPMPLSPRIALVPARILDPTNPNTLPTVPAPVIKALQTWSKEKVWLGASCAGVFALAESGVLDDRPATTHWSLVALFRQRFPNIECRPDALILETERVVVGGGMTSYFDVGLRLVDRLAGAEVARDLAAVFLLDPHRQFQSPFVPAALPSHDTDPVLAQAVDRLLLKAKWNWSVADWAQEVGVDRRTLERRAQVAWGFGPAQRLRLFRLDRARLLLETGTMAWDEIADRCGYRDAGAFRRVFLDHFGQTPGEYRRRFG